VEIVGIVINTHTEQSTTTYPILLRHNIDCVLLGVGRYNTRVISPDIIFMIIQFQKGANCKQDGTEKVTPLACSLPITLNMETESCHFSQLHLILLVISS